MDTKKILVVDDETDVINAMRAILENAGYKVIAANDKVEGLKLAKAVGPDLAILDVMMTTHYEGFELAEDLVNDPDCKNIPILMHTSIEVLTTSEASVRDMAREFRKDPKYRELQVILVKDTVSGNAGIDYRTEDGEAVWVPVGGFLKKPVEPGKLIEEVRSLLVD
jgi:CheY-like chemotaxis protein